jgi:hypothetical protein
MLVWCVDWLSEIRYPSVPHCATQVERVLLRADQCVAATPRGIVWNRAGRAVILVVILMDVYEMTKGRQYQKGKGASVVRNGIKMLDSLTCQAKYDPDI